MLLGVILGAVLGVLLGGPFGLVPGGPAAAAGMGAVAGVIIGGLGGAIYGAGLTDRQLQELSRSLREGKLLLTAECKDLDCRTAAEQIFRSHGAAEVARQV